MHCFGHVHGGYGAQRVLWDNTDTKITTEDDYDEGMRALPVEYVGRNQIKRKGYAMLSPGTREALLDVAQKQTLMVNAAIMDQDGNPTNFPWVVTLPVMDGGAQKRKRLDDEEDTEAERAKDTRPLSIIGPTNSSYA